MGMKQMKQQFNVVLDINGVAYGSPNFDIRQVHEVPGYESYNGADWVVTDSTGARVVVERSEALVIYEPINQENASDND